MAGMIALMFTVALCLVIVIFTNSYSSLFALLFRVFMAWICFLGSVLMLMGMASVSHQYDDEAGNLYHDVALINHAEDIFPNNGGLAVTTLFTIEPGPFSPLFPRHLGSNDEGVAYLNWVVHEQTLGFELFGVHISSQLVVNTLASVVLTTVLTVIYTVFGGG
jgi:hypothetical protein